MIHVAPASPFDPPVRALLEASHALMASLYAAEANHYLSLDALTEPHITLFAASQGGNTLATGALARMQGYGEVKSMFTAPEARGHGLADALLSHIEAEARSANLPYLRLETGTGLDAAHRLYARHGFTPRGPFGAYPAADTSVFMEKSLHKNL
ncbi:GNAT family N-acetyltransferase [Rhodalgimonas zhirmunskyi]|uniref:GNAT family N-acetyltransferase n=1 Tax=Rhodalgimonas zhirmunskyi TaxID=2964767 RepID=A0AAJ1U8X0_9RHOB|nr:GNAT family N-acetyltransferase [Rhodoalgimonas zhirmunskyi]MDQ2095770.1 GNAT family N-acetyltransferase [Rhodoalgimonas zhirmunskyi]